MKIILKIGLIDSIKADLLRPCENAFERVGFLYGSVTSNEIYFDEYEPVDDEDYIKDQRFGAVFNKEAIKRVLGKILRTKKSCFQIHEHASFYGVGFSQIDLKTAHELCNTFQNFHADVVHGSIVLCEAEMNVLLLDVDGKYKQQCGGWYERV